MSLQDRIREAIREKVEIAEYDPHWPQHFEDERKFLLKRFAGIITRVEHFGSTAIPGMSAKPVVDMLIEIIGLKETEEKIVPILEDLGYDYFWRTDVDPPYCWFIKRNDRKVRTHHLHMVEADSRLWERLYFRDYLIEYPDVAREYAELKLRLATDHPNHREAYTRGKEEFVDKWTKKALGYYRS